ncbi:hypothetical protein BLJ79_01310 [Arthrobacter sp. UCD-GKA]|uniref:recombinase family protein n=1 Tax=Arthrobacter sp. UCD-GKA TaxID=1913576 RepID=UPI0008DCEC90|nr:recombinase family protein [Arthrobacter sp. UCD-GKA]OIH86636.1 hypothetical protein BLJ79_01310 [Arthrobacter sp. UCD-GKA]
MKLTEYARRRNLGYRAAWNRFNLGKIPGAYKDEAGQIYVPDPVAENLKSAAIYARVSTHKHKDDLARQSDRMVAFTNASRPGVTAVATEVTSGVNDSRPKRTKLPQDDSWGTPVVEHQDRLARAGFGWFEVLPEMQGRRILVANAAQEQTADLMEDFRSIIYSGEPKVSGPTPRVNACTRKRSRNDITSRNSSGGSHPMAPRTPPPEPKPRMAAPSCSAPLWCRA